MTEEERMAICRTVAMACRWGHSGIASCILDDLDKIFPAKPSFRQMSSENFKRWDREAQGVITDEAELRRWMALGYWLVNWNEDGCSLFNPPPMNGLHKYVSKALADRFGGGSDYGSTFPR